MKNWLVSLSALIFLSLTGNAQDESKYGETPEEIQKCKECLSLYREYRDQDLVSDALPYWRCAINICPESALTLYIDGADFYGDILDEIYEDSTKSEMRDAYVDTLMKVYDMRIQYFGDEGKVLGRKAVDLFKYDRSRAAEANEMLDKAIEIRDMQTDAVTVSTFYQTLYEKYRNGEATKSDLLVEYMPVLEILDYNIARAEDEKSRSRYEKAKNNLDAFFVKIAECDDIYRILGERLAETPNDIELNKKALAVMNKRDCSDNPLYLEVAERVYADKPTAPAAYSIGIQKLKAKAYNDALTYFEEAAELCGDCIELNQYYLRAGQTATILGKVSKARAYANNILKTEPNSGEAYMLIGDAIAASASACDDGKLGKASAYWLATDYYAKAKSVDSSVADKANQKINGYTKYFPAQTDIFFNNLEVGASYVVSCFGESTTVRSSD
jgi:tetratricopeptide (TPR) repeat protein